MSHDPKLQDQLAQLAAAYLDGDLSPAAREQAENTPGFAESLREQKRALSALSQLRDNTDFELSAAHDLEILREKQIAVALAATASDRSAEDPGSDVARVDSKSEPARDIGNRDTAGGSAIGGGDTAGGSATASGDMGGGVVVMAGVKKRRSFGSRRLIAAIAAFVLISVFALFQLGSNRDETSVASDTTQSAQSVETAISEELELHADSADSYSIESSETQSQADSSLEDSYSATEMSKAETSMAEMSKADTSMKAKAFVATAITLDDFDSVANLQTYLNQNLFSSDPAVAARALTMPEVAVDISCQGKIAELPAFDEFTNPYTTIIAVAKIGGVPVEVHHLEDGVDNSVIIVEQNSCEILR